MKLTGQQILDITFGYVFYENTDGGYRFHKCTQKQMNVWAKESVGLGNIAELATGVRLDFHTNSSSVSFEIDKEGKLEILINGLAYKKFESDVREDTVTISLPKGENRVTLAMPSHTYNPVLKSVVIDDGAFVTPHKFDTKILFMGDSITQGWNSDYDTNSYAWQTSLYFNAESVINGIGGAYYLSASFDEIDFDPDTVVIAYGTNDWSHYKTLGDLERETVGFLDKVKAAYGDKKVFCILPIWREDIDAIKSMGTFKECRELIKKVVTDHRFNVVDGFGLVPHNMYFMADAIHPNDIGFAQYTANLTKAMS